MAQQMSETFHKFEGKLEAAVSETGQLLKEVEQKGTERYAAASEKLRKGWTVAKDDMDRLRQKAVDGSRSAAKAADGFAHDHPWTTAGVAAGIGALVGWLVTRR